MISVAGVHQPGHTGFFIIVRGIPLGELPGGYIASHRFETDQMDIRGNEYRREITLHGPQQNDLKHRPVRKRCADEEKKNRPHGRDHEMPPQIVIDQKRQHNQEQLKGQRGMNPVRNIRDNDGRKEGWRFDQV